MIDTEEFQKRNYYERLGVARTATLAEIKEAYREIARVYHPDSNFFGDILEYKLDEKDDKIFQLVTAAYDTLIKEDKRKEYDLTLPNDFASFRRDTDAPSIKGARHWNSAVRSDSETRFEKKLRERKSTFETMNTSARFQTVSEDDEPFCHIGRETRFVQAQAKKKQSKARPAAKPAPRVQKASAISRYIAITIGAAVGAVLFYLI